MLEEVRLRGLGVITDAVLTLGPGLSVITGETGAGKTMVLAGLDLLLGGRADPSLVRRDSGPASVEGRIQLGLGSTSLVRALDAGALLETDTDTDTEMGAGLGAGSAVLAVARTVTAAGRSRAYLGGRGVPAGLLEEVLGPVVSVHGQAQQHRLVHPAEQRLLLDRFGGAALLALVEQVGAAYQAYREASAKLSVVVAEEQDRARELELLRLGLEQVEQVAPRAGEDAELATEIGRLAHADDLRSAAVHAWAAVAGSEGDPDQPSAVGQLAEAGTALRSAAGDDPELDAIAARVAEVGVLSADLGADLARYASGLEADPQRLSDAQQRVSELGALIRRLAAGSDLAAVLRWAEEAGARVARLELGADAAALAVERDRLHSRLEGVAGELSGARSAAAERFGAAVAEELRGLAMPSASVTAVLTQTEAGPEEDAVVVGGRRLRVSASGVDAVAIELSAHAGALPRPLQRGASGGELSRVMLALELVLVAPEVTTVVFDEVDAGIGGRTAVEVGRRLARLGTTRQVLCVTHLAQVAAFADRHLLVEKSSDGSVTSSGVQELDSDARVGELTRMLAGLAGSEVGRAHAEELLSTALQCREADSAALADAAPGRSGATMPA